MLFNTIGVKSLRYTICKFCKEEILAYEKKTYCYVCYFKAYENAYYEKEKYGNQLQRHPQSKVKSRLYGHPEWYDRHGWD
jgi:hypothetical protein